MRYLDFSIDVDGGGGSWLDDKCVQGGGGVSSSALECGGDDDDDGGSWTYNNWFDCVRDTLTTAGLWEREPCEE